MKFEDELDRECVGKEVGSNIKSCISEVKGVDIDADFIRDGEIPRSFDWVALKYTCQHVGCALAPDDSNHDQGKPSKLGIAKAGVQCENRGFDKSKTGVIKD